MEGGKVLYARHKNIYVLKMEGKIRYTISADIDRFLTVLFKQDDFQDMLIDLTDTVYIDSTNLGLLAKAAKFMKKKFNKKITIIAPFKGIIELLNIVGFDSIFLILTQPEPLNGDLQELPHMPAGEKETARVMLEAHRYLIELNSRNQEVFKDIVELLEEELGKIS